MARQTFVTVMPNRTGAFLAAARVFHREGVNMIRVSYNKAVDLHTLFIDGEGEPSALERVKTALDEMGYLARQLPEIGVVPIEIDIPDQEGALLPVLEILARYDINISYLNSTQTGESCQHFLMGLLIDKPALAARLLAEVNTLYPVASPERRAAARITRFSIFPWRIGWPKHCTWRKKNCWNSSRRPIAPCSFYSAITKAPLWCLARSSGLWTMWPGIRAKISPAG